MKQKLAQFVFHKLSPYGFWKQIGVTLLGILLFLVLPLWVAYPSSHAMAVVGVVGFVFSMGFWAGIYYLYYSYKGMKEQKETNA